MSANAAGNMNSYAVNSATSNNHNDVNSGNSNFSNSGSSSDDHEELLAEMELIERLPTQERLKQAKRRRALQLKKWSDYEKEIMTAPTTSKPAGGASKRANVNFASSSGSIKVCKIEVDKSSRLSLQFLKFFTLKKSYNFNTFIFESFLSIYWYSIPFFSK